MTPPDQNDEQPSALSRLERALAGFGEPRAEESSPPPGDAEPAEVPEDEPDDEPEGEPVDDLEEDEAPAPVSPFATDAALETWEPPSSDASSPVLDIASAVEAVERLSAVPRGESVLETPLSDSDEFVLAATAAGTEVFDGADAVEDEEEDLRLGVDEGSDLLAEPDESYPADESVAEPAAEPAGEPVAVDDLPPPRSDAAASWARDDADSPLPYFLVEDNLPVAAEPVLTLEELRQTVPAAEPRKASVARTLAEIPILLLVAALIAFLVKTFLAQAYYIPSGSMEPQLLVNDRVVVSKLAYELHDPRRGDIVVFDDPNSKANGDDDAGLLHKIGEGIGIVQPSTDEFIKRVIALPGETVEGRDGAVYVNGRRLEEPYLPAGPRGVTTPFDKQTVRPGRVWVMGDNRTGSADSRVFGQIRVDSIVGRAVVTVWPVAQAKFL